MDLTKAPQGTPQNIKELSEQLVDEFYRLEPITANDAEKMEKIVEDRVKDFLSQMFTVGLLNRDWTIHDLWEYLNKRENRTTTKVAVVGEVMHTQV